MQSLEFRYIMYINELQKSNMFIWMFRGMYKRKLRKRHELLLQQYDDGEIGKYEFDIYSEMLLKAI